MSGDWIWQEGPFSERGCEGLKGIRRQQGEREGRQLEETLPSRNRLSLEGPGGSREISFLVKMREMIAHLYTC